MARLPRVRFRSRCESCRSQPVTRAGAIPLTRTRPSASPTYVVGDLDGDKRPEVVVSEQPIVQGLPVTEVTALDGVTGAPRCGRGAVAAETPDVFLQSERGALVAWPTSMVAAGAKVCVSFFGVALPGMQTHRDPRLPGATSRRRPVRPGVASRYLELIHVDLDGDGRDELLFRNAGRLRKPYTAATSQEHLVVAHSRATIREVTSAASPGRPASVVVNPSLGVDGATGRPIWSIGPARSILRASDGKRLPRVLTGLDGTTVCRMSMPISADGTYRAAQGEPATAASIRDDPRWERPLPWVRPVEPYADPLVQVATAAMLINVCVPVAILWLATRRRFWSVRLLLALPVLVAILLTGYSALSSPVLNRPQTAVPAWWSVLLAVVLLPMVGIPIVAYATALVLSLVRVRWLKLLLALPVVAAILVAGFAALGAA